MSLLISLLGTFVTTSNTYQAMRAASCWEFHNLLYKDPGLDKSSACVPLSATWPLSKTNIISQLTTVERRWAITIDVRPSVALSNAFMMLFSVMESRDEVASSKTKIGESFRIARAMLTRCFSPPESFKPRSPTWVSYPLGQVWKFDQKMLHYTYHRRSIYS